MPARRFLPRRGSLQEHGCHLGPIAFVLPVVPISEEFVHCGRCRHLVEVAGVAEAPDDQSPDQADQIWRYQPRCCHNWVLGPASWVTDAADNRRDLRRSNAAARNEVSQAGRAEAGRVFAVSVDWSRGLAH
jgi:hypothetical protein